MKEEQDPETKRVLDEGKQFNDLVSSNAWGKAKQFLLDKMIALDSISQMIPGSDDPQKLLIEWKARASTIAIMKEWIGEIEGKADQYRNNSSILKKKDDEIIQRS